MTSAMRESGNAIGMLALGKSSAGELSHFGEPDTQKEQARTANPQSGGYMKTRTRSKAERDRKEGRQQKSDGIKARRSLARKMASVLNTIRFAETP